MIQLRSTQVRVIQLRSIQLRSTQPRVIQVLAALADAVPETLNRDPLAQAELGARQRLNGPAHLGGSRGVSSDPALKNFQQDWMTLASHSEYSWLKCSVST